MKRYLLSLSFLLAASTALSACSKEATGQVAAVVNGEEITLQEVNAELGSANIPDGVDKKVAQQAALQRVVDRRLLAQAAKDDGLDETPDFLVRERQLQDALLVQLLSQRAERAMQVPDAAAIDKYIAGNGTMFGQRTIYGLDRIQFPMPADFAKLKVLENDHSMDAVAATLKRLGIQFSRGPAQMDSLQLGPDRLERIKSLPAGEPFVVSENGMVTIGVITGSQSRPIAGPEARPLALKAMQNEAMSAALQTRLKSAKAQAEIKYQDGFAPPASAKPPVS